jgi:hypothetical protein
MSVIERCEEPSNLLREARRVTRPGGAVLLSVPTWLGKELLEFSAFRLGAGRPETVDEHKMYYGRRELWPLLVRSGFRPRDIRLYSHKFGLSLFARAGV